MGWNFLKPRDLPIVGEVWEKRMIHKDYKWLQRELDALETDPDPGDVDDAECTLLKSLHLALPQGQFMQIECPIHSEGHKLWG